MDNTTWLSLSLKLGEKAGWYLDVQCKDATAAARAEQQLAALVKLAYGAAMTNAGGLESDTGQLVALLRDMTAVSRAGDRVTVRLGGQWDEARRKKFGELYLTSLAQARSRARYYKWAAHSHGIRIDRDNLAQYNFEQQGEGHDELWNRAAGDPNITARFDWEPEDFNARFPKQKAQHPAWTSGRWEGKGAMRFDGKASPEGDFLTAENRLGLMLPQRGGFSVCAWVKAASVHDGCIAAIGETANSGFELSIHRGQATFRYGKDKAVTSNKPVTTGQWHHLVGVVDPIAKTVTLFVDGKQASSVKLAGAMLQSKSDLHIARQSYAKAHHFHGIIDDLVMFKRALAPNQIAEMHAVGDPGSTDTPPRGQVALPPTKAMKANVPALPDAASNNSVIGVIQVRGAPLAPSNLVATFGRMFGHDAFKPMERGLRAYSVQYEMLQETGLTGLAVLIREPNGDPTHLPLLMAAVNDESDTRTLDALRKSIGIATTLKMRRLNADWRALTSGEVFAPDPKHPARGALLNAALAANKDAAATLVLIPTPATRKAFVQGVQGLNRHGPEAFLRAFLPRKRLGQREQRDAARLRLSGTQLRGLQLALYTYATSNKMTFGGSLAEMAEDGYFSYEYLFSPFDKPEVPKAFPEWPRKVQHAWLNANTSYVMVVWGQKADENKDRIGGFEKPAAHKKQIPIVWCDTRVTYHTPEEAAKLIKAKTGKTIEQWMKP